MPEADIVLFCCVETKNGCQKDGFLIQKLKKYIQILKKLTLEE